MLKNRFKPIYIDLDSGKWYVTNETSDSNLEALRVRVRTPADSWYVKHWRRTTKVFVQTLDNTNSEVVPEKVTIIDEDTVRIDFFEETAGLLHLVFTSGDFFNILPTPTVTPTMTMTPTVTPTMTPAITTTVTPTVTLTATVTPTVTVTATVTPAATAAVTITPTATVTPTLTSTVTPTTTVTPTPSGSTTTLKNNLLAWWSLDEASNVTRLDSHTNGYDLIDTSANVTQSAAKVSFGATTSANSGAELNAGSIPALTPADTDFTVAGWVNFTSTVGNSFVLSNHDFSVGYNLGFLFAGAGNLAWMVKGSFVSAAVSTGVWYHFVCYHDSVGDEIGMIIDDGTPVTTAHATGIDAPGVLKIMNAFGGAFSGGVTADEIAMWDRLLTGPEVTELYNAGSGIGYP